MSDDAGLLLIIAFLLAIIIYTLTRIEVHLREIKRVYLYSKGQAVD